MKQRVLVMGDIGMLGYAVDRTFREHPGYAVTSFHGSLREGKVGLQEIFHAAEPGVVINCIGVVPQSSSYENPTRLFDANAVLPHRLHAECRRYGARLVHISTDCVFSGLRGNYSEKDTPYPEDLYGKSKLLGEVDGTDAVTIRTSLIGPELHHRRGLLEWFLSQQGLVTGYTNAIFSGLTTLELAKVLRDVVVPNKELFGLFHIGGYAISKFDLLALIKAEYGHDVVLARSDVIAIDRSLNPRRFELLTGYKAPPWVEMIREMRRASN